MRKLSQCEKIVEYMKKHGTITQAQAYKSIGCVRLPSRIHDLKRKGYAIHREMVSVKTKDGGSTSVARYSLIEN